MGISGYIDFALAGMCLFAAMLHGLMAARRVRGEVNLLFSLSCLTLAVYVIATAFLHGAASVEQFLAIFKVRMTAASFFAVFFLWFVGAYTGVRPRRLLATLTALFLASWLIRLLSHSTRVYSRIRSLRHVTLPWGESVNLLSADASAFGLCFVALWLTALGFIVVAALSSYLRNKRPELLLLLLAVSVFFIAVVNDLTVALFALEWPPLAEFGFTGMLLFMSFVISGEALQTMKLRRALQDSEERYRALVETTGTGFVILDTRGRVLDANPEYVRLTGHGRLDEILGRSVLEWTADYHLEKNALAVERCVRDGYVRNLEIDHADKLGRITPLEINATVAVREGTPKILALCRDISERKRVEEQIELLKHSIDVHDDGAYWLDSDDRIFYVNDAGCRTLSYTREEMQGMPLNLINPRATPERMKEIWAQLRERGVFHAETVHRRKDGSEIPVEITSTYVRFAGKEYYCGFARDMTARREAEARLKRSLAEKETLLRELYHRTKNNMQVIRAMLALRSARSADPAVEAIVRETDRRIQAMSMVHQMLYRSQDLSEIDLRQYVSDLAALLLRSYRLSPERIAIEVDAEAMRASINLAIPCGLVLNELMSNALQHAFPGERSGTIRIRLARLDSEVIEMVFSDNGVGVPPGIDPRSQDSLGFRTIIALTESQLRGEARFESAGGVTWRLRFRESSGPEGERS